ncbi:MAG TPA: aminoacyl-tRNA hydrolase [Terriglobales bacterium]|nr:aminoacyl-tRNA hydrolase [Terriglobales bacterium]
MKLIVGLGNPGAEYELTPHNMGFLVIDQIAADCKVEVVNRHCRALTARANFGGQDVLLVKPETFMNLSGVSVRALVEKYAEGFELSKDLIVVYDELDFPLGTIRIRERGSSAGHNGVQSIISSLGTDEFLRVRIGIAPEHPVNDGAKYVLAPWKKKDLPVVGEVIDRAEAAVKAILEDGVAAAMNQVNRRVDGEKV